MRVEKTAGGAGMMRAIEQYARPPLFDDPLAEGLLVGWPAVVTARGPLRRLFLGVMERLGPGFYGAVVCRTRAIDDECRSALAAGVAQVVIVGAGFDTRPYRMPEMAGVPVWEFDLPEVQAAKKAAFEAAAGHVTYRPLDLTSPAAGEVLSGAKIADAPTVLLCEAVTMYLPEDAVERVLAYAGGLPPGSRVILTYSPRTVTENWWSRRLPWRSAYQPDEIAERLTAHGLTPHTDIGAEEHRRRLLAPLGRQLAVFPGERIVTATKRGLSNG